MGGGKGGGMTVQDALDGGRFGCSSMERLDSVMFASPPARMLVKSWMTTSLSVVAPPPPGREATMATTIGMRRAGIAGHRQEAPRKATARICLLVADVPRLYAKCSAALRVTSVPPYSLRNPRQPHNTSLPPSIRPNASLLSKAVDEATIISHLAFCSPKALFAVRITPHFPRRRPAKTYAKTQKPWRRSCRT